MIVSMVPSIRLEKNNNDEAPKQTYKLLMVGNSFSADALSWLWDICESAGIDVVLGEIHIGGCSLKQHWERIENGEEAPFHTWDQTGENEHSLLYNDILVMKIGI